MVSVNPKSQTGQKLAGQYGAIVTPTFVFVRADGTFQNTILGDADEERLREELDRLLATAAE